MIKEVYFTETKWKQIHDNLGGVSGKIVFKEPVSYQDYLSISRKEYLLLDENQDKEIERLHSIIKEIREKVENYDVFKEFTFPLMKRDEEHQVKSSIEYEWREFIKKPILEILDKVDKENI